MSCGCKNGQKSQSTQMAEEEIGKVAFTDSLFMRLFLYVLSMVILLIALVPVVIPLMAIMLFNRIVMNRNTDLTSTFIKMGKKLRTSKKRLDDDDEDDDEEEDEEINPDDYELMDVDVIK